MIEEFEHSLYESTIQNLLNSPKFLSQRIKKRYYKTFGISVIKSLMSPHSLLKERIMKGRFECMGLGVTQKHKTHMLYSPNI